MRIFVIGNNQASVDFANHFAKNANNIVFSTHPDTNAQYVDIPIDDILELRDFASANEMSLTVIFEEKLFLTDILKLFSQEHLSVVAPEKYSSRIFTSKSWAKKFIYRNRVKTPRFQFFEKAQAATEYARGTKFPIVVKPDEHSEYSTRICETFSSAKSAIEEFFNIGLKKVLIEEYIVGKEFSLYTLVDGYKPMFLGVNSTYQNSFAKWGVDFLDEDEILNLFNNTIVPMVANLVKENGEYIGILGFDFILKDDKILLLECNSTFSDLVSKMYVDMIDNKWENMFDGAVSGMLHHDFRELKYSDLNILSTQIYENSKRTRLYAKSKILTNAKNILLDDGADIEQIEEGFLKWKS